MKKLKIVTTLLILVIILTGCGCEKKKDNSKTSEKPEEIKEATLPIQEVDGVEISGFEVKYQDGISEVVAQAKNITNEPIKILTVEIALYNENEEEILTTSGYLEIELYPDEVAPISIGITKDVTAAKTAKYKLNKY